MNIIPDILIGPAMILWMATAAIAYRWGCGNGYSEGYDEGTRSGYVKGTRKGYAAGYEHGKQASAKRQ